MDWLYIHFEGQVASHGGVLHMGKGVRIVIFWKEWATINERTFGIYRKKPSVWTHTVFHQNCWDNSSLILPAIFIPPRPQRLYLGLPRVHQCRSPPLRSVLQESRPRRPRRLPSHPPVVSNGGSNTHFYRRHNVCRSLWIPSAVSLYIEEMNGNETNIVTLHLSYIL